MIKYSEKCSRCAYHHGTIKCVVSPCPRCIGDNPVFPEPEIKVDVLRNVLSKIAKKSKNKKK